MTTHLKSIKEEKTKGKSTTKTWDATDELAYLMTLNQSIIRAVARMLPDRQLDSYLDFVRHGVIVDSGSS